MTKTITMPVERLRELLDYDPGSGILRWRIDHGRWGNFKAGTIAGTVCHDYLSVWLDGRKYMAHRVAWALMTGAWPVVQIDHRDLCGGNNCWTNLREATNGQNQANRGLQKNNTSGFKGVSWHAEKKKWQVSVGNMYRGSFGEKSEAVSVYKTIFAATYGEFARMPT